MSILIKGMEMPKNCDECFLSEWNLFNERFYCPFDDCQLIEVPTPHGDLIDRDALEKAGRYEVYIAKGVTRVCFIFNGQLYELPTVIEAEDEEIV